MTILDDLVRIDTPTFCVESPRRRHRFTPDEYLHMAELGWFAGKPRTELIDGEIVEMSPQLNDHACVVTLVARHLWVTFPNDWVRVQMSLRVGRNLPEPDVAVVAGRPRGGRDVPDAAMLVVEVSDTTLATDRGEKASLYAAGGVADYWVVDVVGRRLLVMRDAHEDAAARFGASYGTLRTYAVGQSVEPLMAPSKPIGVADLVSPE